MRRPKITPEYAERRDRLARSFPSAHAFLTALEGDATRFWLSTATNAHVYSGGYFLAYVRLRDPEAAPPSLVLSPHFNQRIVEGTTDAASKLFPLDALFEPKASWWTQRARGLELTSRTPDVAFDALLRRFRHVADRLVAGA